MDSETRALNMAFLDGINSPAGSAGFTKSAAAADGYVRMQVREDSFFEGMYPAKKVTQADLTPVPWTDKPVMLIEREPESPAAVTVPFGVNPINRKIRGNRIAMSFARIETHRFYKDVDELLTYGLDIRQIFADNAVRDMAVEKDGKFLTACNAAMGVRDSAASNETGVALWSSTAGPMNRVGFIDGKTVMLTTRNHIPAQKALMNAVTVNEFGKLGRGEVGGDMAQAMLVDGVAQKRFYDTDIVVTLKTQLLPTGSVYFFGGEKFGPRHYSIEDVTLYIDRRYHFIEYFAYCLSGAVIPNVAAITRRDYLTTVNESY